MKTSSFLYLVLILVSLNGFSQKILFLHHSTGNNVYNTGKVEDWIGDYNIANAKHLEIYERSYPTTPWSWSNYPYDYWKLWIDGDCDSKNPNIECLNTLVDSFDLIIFKHCFPGASLVEDSGTPDSMSNVRSIENYIGQYRALRELMDTYPETNFMIWTLVPLHRLATTSESARRAKAFVDWVNNEWLTEDGGEHSNIHIFDFFALAAEQKENPDSGMQYCLKYEYEKSHTNSDSHPNTIANETIGPIFAQTIVDVFKVPDKVDSIRINALSGNQKIEIDDGTLQLDISFFPSNAPEPVIIWSTDKPEVATIDQNGLLTAISDGEVIVQAMANDGSDAIDTIHANILNQIVDVSSISLISENNRTSIDEDNGQLLLYANIEPSYASDTTVSWTISNNSLASIDSDGLLTAKDNGMVMVFVSANDGSGIRDSIEIEIKNQIIYVSSIALSTLEDCDTIKTKNGELTFVTNVQPKNATDTTVSWTVNNDTIATITNSGILQGKENGKVTVYAVANDGSGVIANKQIVVENQIIYVDSLNIFCKDSIFEISNRGGKLQLYVNYFPQIVHDSSCTWSISDTSLAQIDDDGLVTAKKDGIVKVFAVANDRGIVKDTVVVNIENQNIMVAEIELFTEYDQKEIFVNGGDLKIFTNILPKNATDTSVTWNVNNTSLANISQDGILTGISDGNVIIRATANDGSGLYKEISIEILNQEIKVDSIEIRCPDNKSKIDLQGGSILFAVDFYPENADDTLLVWSVDNNDLAEIDQSGFLKAKEDGKLMVKANLENYPWIFDTVLIEIQNQSVKVQEIGLHTESGAIEIDKKDQTLQLLTNIQPKNATDTSVTWSVNGNIATIDEFGVLTPLSDGKVTVTSRINDGSGITESLDILISNQRVLVEKIFLYTKDSLNCIDTKGDKLQLLADVIPENADDTSLTWISVKKDIASVTNDGLLVPVTNGKAIVLASANDMSGAVCSIYVDISNQGVPVQDISLLYSSQDTLISEKNGIRQFYVDVNPDNADDTSVTWSVTNEDLVFVDAYGKVIAQGNGETFIKVCSNSEENICDSTILYITNQGSASQLEIISNHPGDSILNVGDTVVLSVSEEVCGEVEWGLKEGSEFANLNQGELIALSKGQVKVTASCEERQYSANKIFTILDVVNIKKKLRSNLLVYPNPTTGILYISGINVSLIEFIQVINSEGEIVMNQEHKKTLDFTVFPDGIYFIKVVCEDFAELRKVIVF